MWNFELCLTWCNLHFMPTEDLLPPVSPSEYPNGDQGTDGSHSTNKSFSLLLEKPDFGDI